MVLLHLGIDIGSTTVKLIVTEPKTNKILTSLYERHNACQAQTAHKLLQEVARLHPNAVFKAAVCGSGGRVIASLIGAPYVQEVVANSIAIRMFYPQTRVAIELGGQDAKIIFFYYDKQTQKLSSSDMRMNGSCAGGTGAFIDEIAALLKATPDEFEQLAGRGKQIYDISGRCGVFAKTDIQPLLNNGVCREDIALSTFHAIAKQTIGGLAQGLELTAPIIFEGGPLTFNPTLVRVFAERLNLASGEIIRPEKPETIVAFGAALSIKELFKNKNEEIDFEKALTSLAGFSGSSEESASHAKPLFETEAEKNAFIASHPLAKAPEVTAKKGDTLRVYLGLDAGSTTTKLVLLDENEEIVDMFYSPNKGEPLRLIKQALLGLKNKYDALGIKLEVLAMGTTGYGELLFDKALGADYHTVETVAHAAAAQKYFPGASFVLDIGGQDMKAISISDGVVTNITVNEACSAGCGSFLENFAKNLNIPSEKIAQSAFESKAPAELGSRCTVFMNSTIITEQRNGKNSADIMAGLCRSIIENVFTKVVRVSNFAQFGEKIVVQGGTFKNDAVLRAIEQYIGREVTRAPYPGEMGAIGIALLTKREIEAHGFTSPHGLPDKTRFIGFDVIKDFDYKQETNLKCTFCTNNCNRTLITFSNGTTWVTGNRCERGEIVGDINDPGLKEKVRLLTTEMESVPDMLKIRSALLFKDYDFSVVADSKTNTHFGQTIGIPRVLDFWRTMPFWTTFFRALGFITKLSPMSNQKLFADGLPFVASDTVCFPAKLVHGHIHALTKMSGIDRIFMPIFARLPSENLEKLSTYTCPVLKGYPLVAKYSNDPERKNNIPFDTPIFHWFSQKDRDFQLCRYMKETFGINAAVTKKAIKQGDASLRQFESAVFAEGKKILDETQAQGKFAVVIAGRQYQFDELINHTISKYFTSIGVPVLTIDAIEGLDKIDLTNTACDITNNNHAQLLAGAIVCAENPALEYVQIYSFGCGHDALYTDETTRILNELAEKSPLVLKLDESDVAGPLRIRVRSFIDTVKLRREKEQKAKISRKDLRTPYAVKFEKKDVKKKTVLIPNVSHAFCMVISAILCHEGVKAVPLPMGGKEAMKLGKQYVHNDTCFPAQMIIGEAIAMLKSGKYSPDEVVVGTGKTMCDCRLTNYMALTRKALDAAGFPQVPIMGTDLIDKKNLHPGFRFNEIVYVRGSWGLIMADVLESLCRKIRPYELVAGETNRVLQNSLQDIADSLNEGTVAGALKVYKKAIDAMCKIEYDRSNPKPQVFVTGEYLLTFHQGANFYIEDYLEKNGMEVIMPRNYDELRYIMVFHTISEIKNFHVHHPLYNVLFAYGGEKFATTATNVLEKIAAKHPLYHKSLQLPQLAALSDHIIHSSLQSGEGFLITADILHYASLGIKSFVILQPFGCLPNHISGRGVIKRIKQEYPGIQILPLDYEPDTSFANIENRLQMLIMNTVTPAA